MLGGTRSTKCPIGLDLGSHSIKMMQLSHRHDGTATGHYDVLAAASKPVGDIPVKGPDRSKRLCKLIEDMLSENHFSGRRVVAGLPIREIQFKNLRVPCMPLEELPSAVEYEAADRLYLDRNSVRMQFINAGEVRQGDEMRQEIILMAMRHEVIEEYLNLFNQLNLEPVAIDSVPTALSRCMTVHANPPAREHNDPITPADTDMSLDAAQVIIEIGASSTKVLMMRDGLINFFKVIEIGGRHFDQAVASTLNLALPEAALVRRRINDSTADYAAIDADADNSPARQQAITNAFESVAGQLAKEIQLCLRYYSVTFRGRRPHAALVVGGEARHKAVVEALTRHAGIELKRISPSSLSSFDLEALRKLPGAVDAQTSAQCFSQWAVAAGLSMWSIFKHNPPVHARKGVAA